MTVADFRRIALRLEGAEEGSHMGQPDFRVGGRIFATLASASQGYGNVKLTSGHPPLFLLRQESLRSGGRMSSRLPDSTEKHDMHVGTQANVVCQVPARM